MRYAFALCLAGCGALGGPGDDAPLATLHVQVTQTAPAVESISPPAAIVWYAGDATTAQLADVSRSSVGYTDLDIGVVTLPPSNVLTSVGARRVALGQLVFYDDLNEDGVPTLGPTPDTIAGAPMNEQLLYLEGPAVRMTDASQLLFAGTQPGFNWLSCGVGATMATAALVDVELAAGTPTISLCAAPTAALACTTGLLLPPCP